MMTAEHKAATQYLIAADPKMAAIIKEVGPCTLKRRGGTFSLLASSIISQQISTHAAATIRRRLVTAMPRRRITAQAIHEFSDVQFQSAGVSQQKRRYLRDLADHVVSDRVNFRRLARIEDEDVISTLVQVKGIGRWTAQMFLLAGLGRPDIFAPDDLGLRNAIIRAYKLNGKPTAQQLEIIAAKWAPYRSVASWYLWRSLTTGDT